MQNSWASLAGGLALAPLGALAAFGLLYGLLALRRGARGNARRTLISATAGAVPGFLLGFWTGFALVDRLVSQRQDWSAPVAACAAGLFCAILAFAAGLPAGIRWAASRGVSNYAGERAAWALYYVSLPGAAVAGAAGFLGAWWISTH